MDWLSIGIGFVAGVIFMEIYSFFRGSRSDANMSYREVEAEVVRLNKMIVRASTVGQKWKDEIMGSNDIKKAERIVRHLKRIVKVTISAKVRADRLQSRL